MKTLAQNLTLPSEPGSPTTTITGPVGWAADLGDVLERALPFIFGFAGFGLLIMIILGGFSLLTSAGDAKKLEKGRAQVTMALMGFIVIFASYWIVQAIGAMLGFTELQSIFPL